MKISQSDFSGYRLQVTGYRLQVSGYRLQGFVNSWFSVFSLIGTLTNLLIVWLFP